MTDLTEAARATRTRDELLEKVSAAIDETLYAYSHGMMSEAMAKESILTIADEWATDDDELLAHMEMLVRDYGAADDNSLTAGAKVLKRRVLVACAPDAPIHEERQMNKDGPVMPRVPSDDLLRRYTSHKINPVEARAIYSCIRDYLSFREKVEQAQNTSSSQGGRYDQAEDALYLTKVVRGGPEPIESPWAEDE